MTAAISPPLAQRAAEVAERGYTVFRFDAPRFTSLVSSAYRASQEVLSSKRFGGAAGFRSAKGTPYQYTHPHRKLREFRELLESQEVVGMTAAVLGNRAAYVTHSKLSFKHFGEEQRWLPHQDAGYKPECRYGCTFAFFLEPCDASNGTLEVFPFSHQLGVLPHRGVSGAGDLSTQLEVETVPGELAPLRIDGDVGDVLCFDLKTLHQSAPNRRGGSRAIFLLEVEPLVGAPYDDLGLAPFVINGNMSRIDKLISLMRGSRRRARMTVSRYKNMLRDRIGSPGGLLG